MNSTVNRPSTETIRVEYQQLQRISGLLKLADLPVNSAENFVRQDSFRSAKLNCAPKFRLRLGGRRNFGAQRGLVIAAGAQQQPEDRLDLVARQAERLGAAAAVLEDVTLAAGIADADAVAALVLGDLADERHSARRELQQLAIERIHHRAQEGQGARRCAVGHGIVGVLGRVLARHGRMIRRGRRCVEPVAADIFAP